jgi:hypothetical protein
LCGSGPLTTTKFSKSSDSTTPSGNLSTANQFEIPQPL